MKDVRVQTEVHVLSSERKNRTSEVLIMVKYYSRERLDRIVITDSRVLILVDTTFFLKMNLIFRLKIDSYYFRFCLKLTETFTLCHRTESI